MRFSKRFLVFALLLASTLFWKLNNWNDKYAAVESFRGAALNKDVLYPLMSKNLNDSGQLKVYINGQPYLNTAGYTILDDSLNPVGSLEFIRKELMGSAFMVDDSSALIQITNDIFSFTRGEKIAYKGQEELELEVAPYEIKFDYAKIHDIANEAKEVPQDWINPEHNGVTKDMLMYLRPLVIGLPDVEYRDGLPVFVTR